MTEQESIDWKAAAEQILTALQQYEDAHPLGAPCFRIALDECGSQYLRTYGAKV